MSESRTDDPFESAVSRLPFPLLIVDGENLLRPVNDSARELWSREKLASNLVSGWPSHPLSRLISRLRRDHVSDTSQVIDLSPGSSYEVITSERSLRGKDRWLMMILRPAGMRIDMERIRATWSLTARESAIAAGCLAGRTSAEICEELSIGPATLKTHIKSLLRKTDTRRRSELVAALLLG